MFQKNKIILKVYFIYLTQYKIGDEVCTTLIYNRDLNYIVLFL